MKQHDQDDRHDQDEKPLILFDPRVDNCESKGKGGVVQPSAAHLDGRWDGDYDRNYQAWLKTRGRRS